MALFGFFSKDIPTSDGSQVGPNLVAPQAPANQLMPKEIQTAPSPDVQLPSGGVTLPGSSLPETPPMPLGGFNIAPKDPK